MEEGVVKLLHIDQFSATDKATKCEGSEKQNYCRVNQCLKLFGSIKGLNQLTTNVPHHIETSQLICNANQLNGFYMMGNIGR